jgi:hypothetical protein
MVVIHFSHMTGRTGSILLSEGGAAGLSHRTRERGLNTLPPAIIKLDVIIADVRTLETGMVGGGGTGDGGVKK